METCTAIFLNSMEERRNWKNIYPNRGWKINVQSNRGKNNFVKNN